MELEDSSGAPWVKLPMQLHLFCLSVLGLQRAAAQEGDAVREAQLPALGVGFKVHHQGLKGIKQGRCVKRDGGIEKTEVRTHTDRALKEPTGGRAYMKPPSKGTQYYAAVI